jgi:hypothetical protein
LTKDVKVTGADKVDHWKAGLYTITYEAADSAGLTARAARTVTVNPKPPEPLPKEAPKITIIGSDPIILHSTSSTAYKEQKAKAIDYDGSDISNLVEASGSINRTVPGTYTITYTVKSPASGKISTASRSVKILAPDEKRDPRTTYGYNGMAKTGAKVTHTGIVSGSIGFMDLQVKTIDAGMTVTAQLIDTSNKTAVLTDTFSAAGKKEYMIGVGKYELAVTVNSANGVGKYSVALTMPEPAAILIYDYDEVPLTKIDLPQIAPIGSNPIVLHADSDTKYIEQGAKAVDYLGNDISKEVKWTELTETQRKTPGTYRITYTVGFVSVTRDIRILDAEEAVLEVEIPMPVWEDDWTAAIEEMQAADDIAVENIDETENIDEKKPPQAGFDAEEKTGTETVPASPPTGDTTAALAVQLALVALIIPIAAYYKVNVKRGKEGRKKIISLFRFF